MISSRVFRVLEETLSLLTLSKKLTVSEAQECLTLLNTFPALSSAIYESRSPAPILVLTVEETAMSLRTTPKTIHTYFNNGELTRVKLGYRGTRVELNDIKEFIIRHRCPRLAVQQTSCSLKENEEK